MKYELIAAALGVESISLKGGLLNSKTVASFNEDQLQAIEKALAATGSAELQQKLDKATQENSSLKTSNEAMENAAKAALELNELTADTEGKTVAEQITFLGEKCQEYGKKETVHTIAQNDGKEVKVDDEQLLEGYIDPNAAHNKLLGIGQNVE